QPLGHLRLRDPDGRVRRPAGAEPRLPLARLRRRDQRDRRVLELGGEDRGMTPTYKKLLRALKLDCVYGLDAETYWDSKYTLRTLATTEYVCDPRFEGQIVSVQKDSWTKPKVME